MQKMKWSNNDPIEKVKEPQSHDYLLFWKTFASPGWFEEAPVNQPEKKWAFCVIARKENSGFE